MAGNPDTLPRCLRAWFRSRRLLAEGKKKQQVMNAAVLMPTLALFAALGVFLNDSYFERNLGAPAQTPLPPAVTELATPTAAPEETAIPAAPETTAPTNAAAVAPVPVVTATPTARATTAQRPTAIIATLAWPPPATETPAPTEAATAVPMPEEVRVFIPQSGARYHKTATCSSMVDPTEVTLQEARDQGFTPCKRCNPPE